MEAALINHEFKLYLQPKYLLCNERIGGAEALVRWNPTNISLIYPSTFIPVFEYRSFFLSAHDKARAKAILMNVFSLARDLEIHTGVEEKVILFVVY